MLKHLVQKIIGTKNERELNRLRPRVGTINALEPEMQPLREADFKARTVRCTRSLEAPSNGGQCFWATPPWCLCALVVELHCPGSTGVW